MFSATEEADATMSFRLVKLCEAVLSPVVLPLSVASQLKVEVILLVSGIFMAIPEQTTPLFGLVITGAGFTTTLSVCGMPGQPRVDVGVTV